MVFDDRVVYASYTPKDSTGPPEQAMYELTIQIKGITNEKIKLYDHPRIDPYCARINFGR